MKPLFETIRSVRDHQETIRNRPYGLIESANGKFSSIQIRPYPKIASVIEAHWIQGMKRKRKMRDVCRVYYNQPFAHRNYLAVGYLESAVGTTIKTLFATLDMLEQVAFIKQSDAILAEISNPKISDRILKRRGWDRHLEHKKKRHWIKRFYGVYPESVAFGLEPNESQDKMRHSDLHASQLPR